MDFELPFIVWGVVVLIGFVILAGLAGALAAGVQRYFPDKRKNPRA